MTTILNFRSILSVTLLLAIVHTKILVMDVEDLRKLNSKKDFEGLRKLMGADLGGDHSKRKHLQDEDDDRRLFGQRGAADSRRKLDDEDDDRRLFGQRGAAVSRRRHLYYNDDPDGERRLFGQNSPSRRP